MSGPYQYSGSSPWGGPDAKDLWEDVGAGSPWALEIQGQSYSYNIPGGPISPGNWPQQFPINCGMRSPSNPFADLIGPSHLMPGTSHFPTSPDCRYGPINENTPMSLAGTPAPMTEAEIRMGEYAPRSPSHAPPIPAYGGPMSPRYLGYPYDLDRAPDLQHRVPDHMYEPRVGPRGDNDERCYYCGHEATTRYNLLRNIRMSEHDPLPGESDSPGTPHGNHDASINGWPQTPPRYWRVLTTS
ncbi:hypothetical protein C8J56DRAFT_463074 [Mycena floridula]|nr:hypothetical protein C8J56DRAFT_463074 [Mycena floridula]